MIVCVTVLLTLCIIIKIILKGVLAIGEMCVGPDFRPYQNTLGQSYRVRKDYSKGECHHVEFKTVRATVLREQIE